MSGKSKEIAPLYKRFLSFLLDGLVIYCSTFLICIAFYELKGINISYVVKEWQSIYAVLFGWVYFTFCHLKLKGQTLGDIILNIKVVSLNGDNLKIGQAIGRAINLSLLLLVSQITIAIIVYQLSIIILSIFTLNINPYKFYGQTIWDVFFKTYVVNSRNVESEATDTKKGN